MNDPIQDVLARLDSAATNDGRKFRVVLIGSSEDIDATMHTLHVLQFVEISRWSPLIPVPNSIEMMSILTLYRR